jgi:hypothetical protein
MRKSIVMGAGLAVLLAGCASNGLNRDRPDEFAVARQPSLIIPPDFALVPPTPGAARVQSATAAQAQTLEALFGNAPRSAGETAVIRAAMPWLMLLLSFLVIITYVPAVSLGLPNMLGM